MVKRSRASAVRSSPTPALCQVRLPPIQGRSRRSSRTGCCSGPPHLAPSRGTTRRTGHPPPRSLGPWSPATSALRMSRREMLGERQVAAPLMAQRAAHGALRLAHRRFQPGEGVGIQLAGLRLSGKPQRPSQCQFGHETLVLALALFAPAASRPGQHCAVRRQRGRQVAPCGHTSTVGQRFLRLVLPDGQEERRRTSMSGTAGRPLACSRRPEGPRSACPGTHPPGGGRGPGSARSRHRRDAAQGDLAVPQRSRLPRPMLKRRLALSK